MGTTRVNDEKTKPVAGGDDGNGRKGEGEARGDSVQIDIDEVDEVDEADEADEAEDIEPFEVLEDFDDAEGVGGVGGVEGVGEGAELAGRADGAAQDVAEAGDIVQIASSRDPASGLKDLARTEVGAARARLARLQIELDAAIERNEVSVIIATLEEIVAENEVLGHDRQALLAMVDLVKYDGAAKRLERLIELGRRGPSDHALLLDTVTSAAAKLGLEAQIDLGLRLVEVEYRDLRDPDAALRRLERLDAHFPDHRLFHRTVEILEEEGRAEALVDVLLRQSARLSDPGAETALVRRAAAIREHHLEDPSGAADILLGHLRQSERLDPELERDAIRLLEVTERYADLTRFLEDGLSWRSEPEQLATRLYVARIYRERLGDVDAAERVLRGETEHDLAQSALLEALESLYESNARWGALLDVLSRRVDLSRDPAERSALRRHAASIALTRLDNQALAIDLLTNAVKEAPGDLEVVQEAERLLRIVEDWDGVLDLLSLRLRFTSDGRAKIKARLDMARIFLDVRGDRAASAAALREALVLDPAHVEVLTMLADVEAQRGEVASAISALRTLLRVGPPSQHAEVHTRIGALMLGRLGDRAAAADEFRAALELDPSHLEALRALLHLVEKQQDFVAALDLSVRGASLTSDVREQVAFFERAGMIALERLGDPLRAIDLFSRAVELDPEHFALTATLGELLMTRAEFARALPYLYRAATGLLDSARVAALFTSAGLAAERLGQRDAAIDAYQSSLAREPHGLAPLRRLSELLAGRWVEDASDGSLLLDVGRTLLLFHEPLLDDSERALVYYRMALAKQGLREIETAARWARRAFELDETLVEAMDLLAECLRELGACFEAAEAFRQIAAGRASPSARRTPLLQAAELYAQHGDEMRAAAVLAEVHAYDPRDVDVARKLADARANMGDAVGSADTLIATAECAEQAADVTRAQLLVDAARTMMGPARDRMSAKRLLVDALAVCPGYPAATADLEILLEFDAEVRALAELKASTASVYLAKERSSGSPSAEEATRMARTKLEEAVDLYRYRLDDLPAAAALLRQLVGFANDLGPTQKLAVVLAELVPGSLASEEFDVGVLKEAIDCSAFWVESKPADVEGLRRLLKLREFEAFFTRDGRPAVGDGALLYLQHLLGFTPQTRILKELLALAGDSLGDEARPRESALEQRPGERPIEWPGGWSLVAVDPATPGLGWTIPPDPREEGLDALFSGLAFLPIKALSDTLPDPKPKKKDLVGAAGLGIQVSRPLEHAAAILGSSLPPVYVREEVAGASSSVVSPAFVFDQPALIVNLGAAEKMRADELRYEFGHALSCLRPRALALVMLSSEALRDCLVGFAKLSEPERFFADPKAARKRGRALEKLVPAERRPALMQAASEWLSRSDRTTLAEERAFVMRSAERAGLAANASVTSTIERLKQAADGRVERAWLVPLLRFAASRAFADAVARLRGEPPAARASR